jgi:hypothetical protein
MTFFRRRKFLSWDAKLGAYPFFGVGDAVDSAQFEDGAPMLPSKKLDLRLPLC